jgi:hypothetical protein
MCRPYPVAKRAPPRSRELPDAEPPNLVSADLSIQQACHVFEVPSMCLA